MEYYYQDQLRWNLGFENPNHAAALVASLLPFVWWIWSCWKPGNTGLRWLWNGLMLAVFLGGVVALGMTVSRSGLLAALAAVLWLALSRMSTWRVHWKAAVLAVGLSAVVLSFTGVPQRTALTAVEHDASATNRLVLWQGGLEMISIAPGGVGAGNSGAFFMNWLQEPEVRAGYRTMVNNYLTLMTEQGLLVGTGILWIGCGLVLWLWPQARRDSSRNAVAAAHASLVAFLVGGLFSTTMESLWVWVGPVLALGVLLVLTIKCGRSASAPRPVVAAGGAMAFALLAAGGLWGSGWVLHGLRDHRIVWDRGAVIFQPKTEGAAEVVLLVDEEVLGPEYGKIFRPVAERLNWRLSAGRADVIRPEAEADVLLVSGKEATEIAGRPSRFLVLLAPSEEGAEVWEGQSVNHGQVVVVLPGFDEDGRSDAWKDILEEESERSAGTVTVDEVPGYGINLTQALPGWLEGVFVAGEGADQSQAKILD